MIRRPYRFLVAIMGAVIFVSAAGGSSATQATRFCSPDGRIEIDFRLDQTGAPFYAVRIDGNLALRESRLGLVRDDADFSSGLRLVSVSRSVQIRERYEILTAKRRVNY